MMDAKKAVGLLKHHVIAWEGKFPSGHFEACRVAIEALEKQVPKKPIREFNGIQNLAVCECGAEAYNFPTSFKGCPYCLQAIDWEDK